MRTHLWLILSMVAFGCAAPLKQGAHSDSLTKEQLLEVATVIRASHGAVELSASQQRSIVEDALRQAVGEGAGASGVTPISQARRARWDGGAAR